MYLRFKDAVQKCQEIFFSTVIEVKTSDEFSHTRIGEPGQTSVELEYRKLEIVFQKSFKLFQNAQLVLVRRYSRQQGALGRLDG